MAPPRNGYFYRRAAGRHISLDDPRHQDAVIYFAYRFQRRHKVVCCHTADIAEAEARVDLFAGETLPADDYDKFLIELSRIGRRADQELAERLRARASGKKVPAKAARKPRRTAKS